MAMLGGECSACCGGGGCCYFTRKPAQNSSSEDCGEWFAVIEDCTHAVNPPFDCNLREIGPYATKETAEEEAAESLGSEESLANSYNAAFFDPEITCCNCGGEQPADTVTVHFSNVVTDDPAFPAEDSAFSMTIPRVGVSGLNEFYPLGWDSCFYYYGILDGGYCGGEQYNRLLSVSWRASPRGATTKHFRIFLSYTFCRKDSYTIGNLVYRDIAVYAFDFYSTETDIITKESCSLPQSYSGSVSGTSYSSFYGQSFSMSMDFSVTMNARNPLP